MKHAASRELYEHWMRLRGCNRAPRRSELEPYDLRRVLGDTFILEAAENPAYPFRLAGTQICAAFGREMKGEDFLDIFSDEDLRSVASLLADITYRAAAGVLGTVATSRSGRTVKFEVLVLPLASDQPDPSGESPAFDRVIGVMPAMDRPYWLGSDWLTRHEVVSLRLLHPVEGRPREAVTPARVVDLEQSRVVPVAARGGPRRFVVVEGGKR